MAMLPFIGELSALAAAFFFCLASVCYTFAGRKVNAVSSLALSLPTAWILLVVIHQFALGEPVPTGASLTRWLLLGTSGILAYVVSQYFMLNAYQLIGPRLTMLILSLAPLLVALQAWYFLGQTLPPTALFGIAMVTGGILWVVSERNPAPSDNPNYNAPKGLLYAGLGTLAQASAFIFSTEGVSEGFPPFSASLIRITAGILALWALLAVQGRIRATAALVRSNTNLFLQLTGAAVAGPIVAGSLLLLSFQYIPVGVSTTLSHTTSIMMIPIGYLVFRERASIRSVIGTMITIVGIWVLFS